MKILETRLFLLDKSEDCAVFESGMSAISKVLMELFAPGDLLLYSRSVYGKTDHFINHFLKKMQIETVGLLATDSKEQIIVRIQATRK